MIDYTNKTREELISNINTLEIINCDNEYTILGLIQQKDNAYLERNKLVAHLSKIYKSHLAKHDKEDESWLNDWRNIVITYTLNGEQMGWHIHDSDLHLFEHLEYNYEYKYDGHTTDEKYKRLLNINK